MRFSFDTGKLLSVFSICIRLVLNIKTAAVYKLIHSNIGLNSAGQGFDSNAVHIGDSEVRELELMAVDRLAFNVLIRICSVIVLIVALCKKDLTESFGIYLLSEGRADSSGAVAVVNEAPALTAGGVFAVGVFIVIGNRRFA